MVEKAIVLMSSHLCNTTISVTVGTLQLRRFIKCNCFNHVSYETHPTIKWPCSIVNTTDNICDSFYFVFILEMESLHILEDI